ncbi:MAG: branched-chain amino acid ABC transporter permease [Desulfobacterales bacterium]|nr:branched-chain amino acid ABC transporter permease [Desulfobacterales bacterium]MDD4072832.1 branched-chain amino acid ABC transporter permease [Desulfobacterales bacterium]MDD4391296.1 branched-chain amino acid ABC transporter permease [Desulfobacterales bacterium]
MQEILQYLFSGITSGAVYAVTAIGLSMLYSSTDLINFSHGEFVMLGAMGLVTLWVKCSIPLPLAFILTVLGVSAAGLLFERFAIRTARKPEPIVLVIITVGASIFLRGIAMTAWGKDSHSVPAFSDHAPIDMAGATLLPQSIWIIAALVILVMGLYLFFTRSLTGKAMTACAINRRAAWLAGIPSDRMTMLAFGMSSGIGAIAGIFIAPITMNSYDMGTLLGLKGFCAAMIGGLGSLWGALAGGFLLGILEAAGVAFFPSGIKDAIAFLALLLILYVRPQGLFAAGEARRF